MSGPKSAKPGAFFVSTADLATALNISSRRVNALAQDGVLPRAGARNRFELLPCLYAYMEYLQRALGMRATTPVGDALHADRALRSASLALKLETKRHELTRMRSESIAIADSNARIARLVQETRAVFAEVPARAAAAVEMAKGRSAIEHAIKHECMAALRELAGRGVPVAVAPSTTAAQAATRAKRPHAAMIRAPKKGGRANRAPRQLRPNSRGRHP